MILLSSITNEFVLSRQQTASYKRLYVLFFPSRQDLSSRVKKGKHACSEVNASKLHFPPTPARAGRSDRRIRLLQIAMQLAPCFFFVHVFFRRLHCLQRKIINDISSRLYFITFVSNAQFSLRSVEDKNREIHFQVYFSLYISRRTRNQLCVPYI